MNSSKILLRQIHPLFIQKNKISNGAFEVSDKQFIPNSNDQDKLSVYNGEKYTAEQAYEHYVGFKGRDKSGGVLGVSEVECASLTLPTAEDNDPFNGHSYIDFAGKDTKVQKSCGKELKRMALARGWLFMPE